MTEMEVQQQAILTIFLKWASDHGVSDSPSSSYISSSCLGHSLCISNFPEAGGRGLAAVRELKKGELILRVPKSALMTSDSVLDKDHELAHAFNLHRKLSSTQVLTVCLLAEMNKGRKSAWYPYLMQLPRSCDILASFGPFETKALQVEDAIWVTEKVISKAESDWREAIALLKHLELKPQLVTFKAWLWASAMISTRTLHVPWDSAGCLCPVGDFFNYAAPGDELAATGISSNVLDDADDPFIDTENSDCSSRLIDGGYEEDVAAYCFYAKKNYRLGEQVLLSYGTYTNLELLEHYGFLLNRNPNDKVIIPLEHDIFTCHSWPADSLYIQHDGKPSFALLSALRLWKTPPNQRKLVGYLALSGLQLSPENETVVMKWLLSNCQAILRNLPSTIEDDQSLLAAIDKAQQIQSFEKPTTLPSAADMEFCKFFVCMETCYGASEVVLDPSFKVKRSMERWKMAVQWRLRYKQTLLDCISYCSHTIASLSPENGTNCRTIQDQIPP